MANCYKALRVYSIHDLVVQTTYVIISLVTVRNPIVKTASASIWFHCEFSNEDILLVENDIKKLRN